MDNDKTVNDKTCACNSVCESCGHCGCCHGHLWHHKGNVLVRWLLGILVLLLVFWMGLKIGEFKGEFGNDGVYSPNWGMMRGTRQPYYNMMPNYYYPTGGAYGQPQPGQAVPQQQP